MTTAFPMPSTGSEHCCCCSAARSCPTLCDPMNWSTSGFSVLHNHLECAQIQVHWVSDAIQPPHPLPPLLLLPSIVSSIRIFSSELAVHIRCPKYCSFSFSISPSNEYSEFSQGTTQWWEYALVVTKMGRKSKKAYIYMYICSFPGGSEDKASACNAGDPGSIPGLGRSPGEGNGNPLQYSCLENPMDRGAWRATVHGVAKNRTRLSDFTHTHVYMYVCMYITDSLFYIVETNTTLESNYMPIKFFFKSGAFCFALLNR